MGVMRIRDGIFFLFAAAAFSCAEPSSEERFVRAQDAPDGEYRFMVDLSDSTAVYDLDFYTMIDGSPSQMAELRAIPLEVSWVSPDLRHFSERVLLDPAAGSGSGVSRQMRVPYRRNVSMYVPGAWSITVTVPEGFRLEGMRGLGLVCEKRK